MGRKWRQYGNHTHSLVSVCATATHSAHMIISLSLWGHDILDTFMQKTARLYQDTRTATATSESNLERLNGDLQDVTRIMTKNMEELLWRGDSLDSTFSTPTINDFVFLTNPIHFFSPYRDVPLVHIVTLRVGEISQSGAGYQSIRHAPSVGTRRGLWSHFHHFLMVEIFLIYFVVDVR